MPLHEPQHTPNMLVEDSKMLVEDSKTLAKDRLGSKNVLLIHQSPHSARFGEELYKTSHIRQRVIDKGARWRKGLSVPLVNRSDGVRSSMQLPTWPTLDIMHEEITASPE